MAVTVKSFQLIFFKDSFIETMHDDGSVIKCIEL